MPPRLRDKKPAMTGQMDLRAAAGQLLGMGFEGTEISGRLKTCIATLQPGGVILFARNIVDAQQTHTLLAECQKLVRTPLFTCVDMEGGTVDRLKNIIAPAPSAADAFATGNQTLFRQHGRLIGEEVRALGFNTDFAPMLDLALPPSSAVLTSRAVSSDPQQTTLYAREFLHGLREAGVLGCGKHFPGLGEATLDSHYQLPTIHKPWEKIWEEDLYPYRTLHRQLPFVIVSHAAFPSVTGNGTPASLSRHWIAEVLRKKIGYRGLVVSDDLEMAGATVIGSVEQAAVEALRAGTDIYLVCRDLDHVWASFQAVLREAEGNKDFARQIMRSAKSVLAFKKKSREVARRVPRPSLKMVESLRRKLQEFAQEVTAQKQLAPRAPLKPTASKPPTTAPQ